MRALILGGFGKIGSLVGQDLLKNDDVTKVTLADINLNMAKVPESIQKGNKVSAEYLDVNESFS